MASKRTRKIQLWIHTFAAWLVGLVYFFPIFWLGLTSLKTEQEAIASPPQLFFTPTLDNFLLVQDRSDYVSYAINSIITSFGATALALLIALPGAYAMAFAPTKWTKDVLLWMLSTKMLPAVGVLMPIYLISQQLNLLDTRFVLVVIFAMINLPIVIWMLFSYFRDIPKEIIEASRLDGAPPFTVITEVVMPLAWGGIASTALLSVVLCWNEAFWSINLTSSDAGTMAALVASYSSPEGLFWAKLSAVSVIACFPMIIFGSFCQRQLVQGLTFGAVK